MFKPADHTRRIPSYLQAYTKENIIAQLVLTVIYLVGMWTKELYEERQMNKRYEQAKTNV